MIDVSLVERIAKHYAQYRHDRSLLMRLQDAFPQVRFTHCRDDELQNASPVFKGEGFNLYLVGGEHCLSLNSDYSSAKGVVVAEVEEDDE